LGLSKPEPLVEPADHWLSLSKPEALVEPVETRAGG
jgi:hypothetical protein